jgi:hypothetical protein
MATVPRAARRSPLYAPRGLAPKASSDLESLRALRRKLAESSNKNKNGVGAAKVLGDLARLGGYNSWDQVPTKRDPHGRNDGDLDALLMSPASEADVIRARDALDATPKSVSEARLRAAYAVDVQRRRVRMSSPKPDGDRDGSVPVSPYAYGNIARRVTGAPVVGAETGGVQGGASEGDSGGWVGR